VVVTHRSFPLPSRWARRLALASPSSETFYLIVAIVMGVYIQPQLLRMQLAKAMAIALHHHP